MFARLATAVVAAVAGATLSLGIVAPTPAQATEPGTVAIPAPCTTTHPYAASMSMSQLQAGITANWGFETSGSYWTDETYRPIVKAIWESLDAVACTPYLGQLKANAGKLPTLNATVIDGWVAGNYGLTKAGAVSLDFPQLLTSYQTDPAHVNRLFIHELTHAYSANRGDNPAYWREFSALYAKQGKFGSYGNNQSEVMSEVVGYYVARCDQKSPYDASQTAYYAFAKKIFGGKEFGAPLGSPLDCSGKPAPAAAPPAPATPAAAPAMALDATPAVLPTNLLVD